MVLRIPVPVNTLMAPAFAVTVPCVETCLAGGGVFTGLAKAHDSTDDSPGPNPQACICAGTGGV